MNFSNKPGERAAEILEYRIVMAIRILMLNFPYMIYVPTVIRRLCIKT